MMSGSTSTTPEKGKARGRGNKDKKRKRGFDGRADGEGNPPPTALPAEGICLLGKLVRKNPDELSMDNTAVHRITGMWAMEGLSEIREEPDLCETFEYEHRCSGNSAVFPLSGRYTGFFYVSEAGERTKVAERYFALKFRPNNAGYHNVEGRGSNVFGKYDVAGTLSRDGTITLFRHFQARKAKASEKAPRAMISAPANGSRKAPPKAGGAVAARLSIDDVNGTEGDEPAKAFTAAKNNKEKEAAKRAKRKAKEEKKRKRKAESEVPNESKRTKLVNMRAPDANMTRVEYNLLVEAIKQVQDQIVGLHDLVEKSLRSNAATGASPPVVAAAKANSDASIPSYPAEFEPAPQHPMHRKKKQLKELQPLSFEEKEALSEAINLLPERLLPGAARIIREAGDVGDDDDEIVLDIDQLDTKAQRKLRSFVMVNVNTNVKTEKKKKQPKKATQPAPTPPACAPLPVPLPSPPSPPPPEETKLSVKPFFELWGDDDIDDDKEEDEEEDLQADFATIWAANPRAQEASEEKEAVDGSNNDGTNDLWEAAQIENDTSKALAEDRAKRKEKMKVKAETKCMAEVAALGEQARAKREEKAAARARLLHEQEREAKEARNATRKKALQYVNSLIPTIDIGEAQRSMMEEFEKEFNDNYSAGSSPSSDFGFTISVG